MTRCVYSAAVHSRRGARPCLPRSVDCCSFVRGVSTPPARAFSRATLTSSPRPRRSPAVRENARARICGFASANRTRCFVLVAMPVLAVVGSPDVAHAVRAGFVQGECEPSCSEAVSALTCAMRALGCRSPLTLRHRWQVDTRYYSAEVQVEVRRCSATRIHALLTPARSWFTWTRLASPRTGSTRWREWCWCSVPGR